MRVLLATERADLGEALFTYLSEQEVQVVGVASALADLPVTVAVTRPHLVLVDALLLEGDRAAALEELRPALGGVPIVLLAGGRDETSLAAVGAAAIVSFDEPPAALLAALRSVAAAP
jgi:DNA-binding NarL/FixJ family response regulator